jgi:hypothetical protein
MLIELRPLMNAAPHARVCTSAPDEEKVEGRNFPSSPSAENLLERSSGGVIYKLKKRRQTRRTEGEKNPNIFFEFFWIKGKERNNWPESAVDQTLPISG